MKKIIVLILCIFWSCFLSAKIQNPEWIFLNLMADKVKYKDKVSLIALNLSVDINSIISKDDSRIAWLKLKLQDPKDCNKNSEYCESRIRAEFNCHLQESDNLEILLTKYKGKVEKYKFPQKEWESIQSGGIYGEVFNFVCADWKTLEQDELYIGKIDRNFIDKGDVKIFSFWEIRDCDTEICKKDGGGKSHTFDTVEYKCSSKEFRVIAESFAVGDGGYAWQMSKYSETPEHLKEKSEWRKVVEESIVYQNYFLPACQ